MGDVLFYHLTESSAAQTLQLLLPKAVDRFGAVELRGPSRGMMEELDRLLWLGPDDGFLPHGLQGGADEDQPILLTWDNHTDRPCVMSVGGADISAETAQAAARSCILFDGHDPDAESRARDQWRALTGAGLKAQYWAQEGGWVKKAESAG